MRIEEGIVEGAKEGKVKVRLLRSPYCERCGICKGGGQVLEIEERREFKVGERIKVGIPEGRFALVSIASFLPPLLFLMMGAWVGEKFFTSQRFSLLTTFIFFLVGLGIAFILSRIILKTALKKVKILE
ncbi:SoxR reducing system RseC family protein [Candidatus Calescamantes bacterium]|nr:SoxR reducing system RseC family protein [Candidatus Calescamantes bacterium]